MTFYILGHSFYEDWSVVGLYDNLARAQRDAEVLARREFQQEYGSRHDAFANLEWRKRADHDFWEVWTKTYPEYCSHYYIEAVELTKE